MCGVKNLSKRTTLETKEMSILSSKVQFTWTFYIELNISESWRYPKMIEMKSRVNKTWYDVGAFRDGAWSNTGGESWMVYTQNESNNWESNMELFENYEKVV